MQVVMASVLYSIRRCRDAHVAINQVGWVGEVYCYSGNRVYGSPPVAAPHIYLATGSQIGMNTQETLDRIKRQERKTFVPIWIQEAQKGDIRFGVGLFWLAPNAPCLVSLYFDSFFYP
jgi:hypothetical protein